MTSPSITSDLIERGLTGKIKCPSLEPTLNERPLSSKEWRAFGIDAAEALSQLTREVDELREAAQQARKAIIEAARDTLWCDETRPAETVVDRIDAALSRSSGRVSDATE